MPYLSKKIISQYFRTECQRQIRLDLSPDNQAYRHERTTEGMPQPLPPRPGLEQIAQLGEDWQARKLHDLTEAFDRISVQANGYPAVIGDSYRHSSGQIRYRRIELATRLINAAPFQFLVEAEYGVEQNSTFESALGLNPYRGQFNLNYANLRPDIIQVLPASTFQQCVEPNGRIEELLSDDPRLQLRIIDVKLTAEPSPGYFAEVAYYAMTLAGWLLDNQLDTHYVVVPNCAIWPGSHEASNLSRCNQNAQQQGRDPTLPELLDAFETDLETTPFEVFAIRLRRFLREELPFILSQPWRDLDWHVDNRCKGCEYLGYPWPNRRPAPEHCMPMAAQQDHLSQVAFVSRGASSALRNRQVNTVTDLAQRPVHDSIFNTHQTLRATRTVVSSRATALQGQVAYLAPQSGTSAIMPKWADLRIYLSVDFDLGSAITFAFGIKAFWLEPRDFGDTNDAPRQNQSWPVRTFIVDQRDIQTEQRELLALLEYIYSILSTVQGRNTETTVQFYIWDSLQVEHFTRVIGRHLNAILANQDVGHLAWLFPPEELLPNPALSTRKSPITQVRDVIRSQLAAPIAHYYTLLGVARLYHEHDLAAHVAQFNVHPLFEDELSDQIPSERAHEIWSRSTARGRYWQDQMRVLNETVRKRLDALATIVRRLESDLRETLGQTSPRININPPQRLNGISFDGQLWFTFAKLNEALNELKISQIRAMPPHEREARFNSARLRRRLSGQEEQQALIRLGLQARQGRRVYQMRDASREVKLRTGDFNFAIAPELEDGFLDRNFRRFTQGTALEPQDGSSWRTRLAEVTQVTIAAIDREQLLLAFDSNSRYPSAIDDLEAHGLVDFSRNIIIDPVHQDTFTRKLLSALQAIGNPPVARNNPLVRRATGQTGGRGARRTAHTPPADLLWDALSMHNSPIARNLTIVHAALNEAGVHLNPTQWSAWEQALSRRLQLIWGPPGTGKSQTARAIILGVSLDANIRKQAYRILICSSTYTAMDNVLLDVNTTIRDLLSPGEYSIHRLRSYRKLLDPDIDPSIDVEVNRYHPSLAVTSLINELNNPSTVTIVGSTPEQVHNLMLVDGLPQQEWFDLVLIDEASQVDVAHAILPLCSLAEGGCIVLAGDLKQLAPIHQAEAPLDLEALVGSIYRFCKEFHQVPEVMLDINYRSNAVIVDFAKNAGYLSTLTSNAPDMSLNFVDPLPVDQPEDWPMDIHWTPEWSLFLDPEQPAVCFTYSDGQSSQWNEFEADAVVALIKLLAGRMADSLTNQRDTIGNTLPFSNTPYTDQEFWRRAVGVVTPHRAQQGLIVSKLQRVFETVQPSLIRDAVDTVERFQGQQRDIIIASFALGDPDAIQNEDEFLMSLNRFNVMASRPRAKLIVLVSQQVIDHLSSDINVLRESRLLKLYTDSFCSNMQLIDIGYLQDGSLVPVRGLLKWH